MKKCIIILSLMPLIIKSQDIHFSQFSKSTFFLNPSLLGFQKETYKVTLQRRSQWEKVAVPYSTFAFSLEKNIRSRKFFFGAQLINDVAGDAKYKTAGGNISIAKKIGLNKKNKLSLAGTIGVFQRSLVYDNLIFHEEENYKNRSFWFPDVNLGVAHQYKINKTIMVTNGISLFHLNKPKQSLTEQNSAKLSQKTNFHTEVDYMINYKIRVVPKIFVSSQGKENEIIFACHANYLLEGEKKVLLEPGISYRLGDAIIYNLGVKIDDFEFMFSYDYNTSSLSRASNHEGGMEIVIVYTWDIKEKDKTIKIKSCPKYL